MREGRVFRRCTLCGTTVDGSTYTCSRGHKSPRTGPSRTYSWAYVVDITRPGAAKRKQRRGGGFETAEDARNAMTRLQVGVEDGTLVDPSAVTVGEWLDLWLAGVQVKPSTRDSYELHVRRRITPHIGDMRLQHLRPADVRALYAKLRAQGGQGGRPLSPKTVHNVHLCLRVALARAVQDQLIAANPADSAHKLPDAPEMRYWTPSQLRAFLEHVADDRLFALWRLAATTGMRRGELLGLQWRDLDLDGRVATIRRQWAKSNGGVSTTTLKGRQGKPRTRRVDLDAVTVAALRRHSAQQLEERVLDGRGRRPDDGSSTCATAHPSTPTG